MRSSHLPSALIRPGRGLFPELTARRRFMNLFIHGALRFPCVFRTAGFESVAVWIPPGAGRVHQRAGSRHSRSDGRARRFTGWRGCRTITPFGEAHPHTEPHYYLSLLGNHQEHRGRGLGMALLRENLTRVDAQRMPAYLESTNPANDHRYQSVGFRPSIVVSGTSKWTNCNGHVA